jgi:hypothetical protein
MIFQTFGLKVNCHRNLPTGRQAQKHRKDAGKKSYLLLQALKFPL